MANFLLDDGIIVWFDGPEWDEVATEAFRQAAVQVRMAAQNNAVWEDRTGDARALLDTDVENSNGDITMILEHGVEYGYWLEVIQNGRFSIIMKTLEEYAPMVIASTIVRLRSSRQGRRYT